MKNIFFRMLSAKYLEIILAVGLFIILDAGVLLINFYTSYQIASDAHAIQVASRQTTLSQNLFHELYQVRDDAMTPDRNYQASIDKLADTYKTFDETMDAFLYGGELIGSGQGSDSLLQDEAYRKTNEATLKKAEEIWQAYRTQAKSVAYAYFNGLSREDVIRETNEAIAYARENNQAFYELLTGVAHSMEDVAQQKAKRLRLIQTVGITLAVLNFFLILFHFLRKLKRSDAEVEKARQETTDILANVNEGLMLLDRDFRIGSQYSASLSQIFNQNEFAGRNFLDLLKPLVTQKTMAVVRDYVEILFADHVSGALVQGLNPLIEVEISIASKGGEFAVRYLSFDFSRVMEQGRLAYLLVTVSNITDRIEMQKQLKKAEEKAAADMDMLLHVIHLDGNLLHNYLTGMRNSLGEINHLLMKPAKNQPQYVEKLLKIFRIAHTLKGECTALDLTFMESRLHDFEDLVQSLKNNQKLTGTDFISLTVSLNRLMTDVDTLRMLVRKVSGTVDNREVESNSAGTSKPVTGINKTVHDLSVLEGWRTQFEQVVNQTAKDHNKAVKLTIEAAGGRVPRMSAELREMVKNIVIQCLRNAVVHGIEPPSLRSLAGKTLSGSIKVLLEQEENHLLLRIRDDGRGLDVNAIRERASAQKLYPAEKLDVMKPDQLVKLIFMPGFSTFQADERSGRADRHAGRGVGLDVVKALVDSSGARMGISYREGEYTEFRFRFDLSSKALQAAG